MASSRRPACALWPEAVNLAGAPESMPVPQEFVFANAFARLSPSLANQFELTFYPLQYGAPVMTMDLEQIRNRHEDFRTRYTGCVRAAVPMENGSPIVKFSHLGHTATTAIAGHIFMPTQVVGLHGSSS